MKRVARAEHTDRARQTATKKERKMGERERGEETDVVYHSAFFFDPSLEGLESQAISGFLRAKFPLSIHGLRFRQNKGRKKRKKRNGGRLSGASQRLGRGSRCNEREKKTDRQRDNKEREKKSSSPYIKTRSI